jgi:hypothetical protein
MQGGHPGSSVWRMRHLTCHLTNVWLRARRSTPSPEAVLVARATGKRARARCGADPSSPCWTRWRSYVRARVRGMGFDMQSDVDERRLRDLFNQAE